MVLVLGIALSGWGSWQIWAALRTRRWNVVTGHVRGTRIDTLRADQYGGERLAAVIEYTYDVDGVSYESDRWSFGGSNQFDSDPAVNGFLAGYRIGSELDVYVDPSDPGRAVLEVGDWRAGGYKLFIGALAIVAVLLRRPW